VILYDPRLPHGMYEFGIQIPVMDSRASETYARLTAHPELGPRVAEWHLREVREAVRREDLLRAHSCDYVQRLFSSALETELVRTYELVDAHGKYHRYDPVAATLPLTAMLDRILVRVGGTTQTCRTALGTGFCFYFGGGMHHAQRDFGKGFCLLNDLVIALRKLQAEGLVRTAWVIDVDAHKGDGTAAITRGDDSIATLSIHMASGWPLDEPEQDADGRPNPSFIPSTIDIGIESGEEAQYVPRLHDGLERLPGRPDLALVVSGADPYELDELPSTAKLRLTLDQLMERDRLVYAFLKSRGIPAGYVMAGGYGRNSWRVYTQFLEWALLDRLG
jgi:acetoin utilization deacetylase AcuC-like enzyme